MHAAPAGSTPTTRDRGVRARRSQVADAGQQPAAADGDDHEVGRAAELLDDLARDRALAGDGARVVEGGHEHGAGLARRRRARRRAASS